MNQHAGTHCILGFKGSGKSSLSRNLCAYDERLIVCDTAQEYSLRKQWVPAVEADELRELVLTGEPFRVAYVPDNYDDVQKVVGETAKTFGGIEALTHVNLTVEPGSITGVTAG